MSFAFHNSARSRWITTLVVCLAATAFLTSCKNEPDTSTPKKAALAFGNATMAGDMDTVHKVAIGTDAQFNVVKNMGELMQAMKRYEAATVKKFGDAGKLDKEMNKDIVAEIEASEEKIDGDSATLIKKDNKDDKHPMKLKKDGGNWKVDLASMLSGPEVAELSKSTKPMVDGLDAATKDVDAGKFKTADEAKAAMFGAMMAAAKDEGLKPK